MKNGFNYSAGVDNSTLNLLLNPLFVIEDKEEEEIKKRKLKETSIVCSTDVSPEELFEPRFFKKTTGKKTSCDYP